MPGGALEPGAADFFGDDIWEEQECDDLFFFTSSCVSGLLSLMVGHCFRGPLNPDFQTLFQG